MGLTYATACRGACHLKSWTCAAEMSPDYEPNSIVGKAALVKNIQDFRAMLDSGVACVFASRALAASFLAEFLTCVTGITRKTEDVATLGAGIYDLERAAAVACGVRRADDTLPERLFTDPVGAEDYFLDPMDREQFERMLDEYYDLRGWNRDGVPTGEVPKVN
jgi:aldehyde:ferredoxin oxidoreductase